MGRLTVHRFGGPLLFGAVLWVAFKMTTDVAAPFIDWIGAAVGGPLYRWLSGLFAALGLADTWVQSLVVDGALAGVGTVLAFIPILVSLYAVLAVLEQSGYLARGARSVENAARTISLPGSAMLPISLGFGCTVPALLALRSVERARDRVLAGMLVPFMACAARLPVFVLLATAFFVDHRTLVVFSMYLLGIGVAVVIGAILGRTVLRSAREDAHSAPLPPLRVPSRKLVVATVRGRTASFIRGAGTVVLSASLAVWLLLAIPVGGSGSFGATPVESSAFASFSRTVAPAMQPLGLGDWTQTGALLTGLIAKEVTISTLAQSYGLGGDAEVDAAPGLFEDLRLIGTGFLAATRDALVAVPGIIGIDLRPDGRLDGSPAFTSAIRSGFDSGSNGRGAAAALAFMVFVLLYTPCVVALTTTRRELGLRWMWVSALGQLAVAWLVAFAAFRFAVMTG